MAGTLALSAGTIIKCGANVSSNISDGTVDVNPFIEQAEGYLCALTKYDLVGNWATISGASVSPMLTEYCERSGAVEGIGYDMSSYTSRVEAEDMINVHLFEMGKIKEVLGKADVQDFMGV